MRASMRRAAGALVLLLCARNSMPANDSVRHYLDEATAATVTVLHEPLIFALEHPERAINARDYVNLTVVEINRSGARRLYWFGYFWSTVERMDPKAAAGGSWTLMADGRPIPLSPVTAAPRELGVGHPPLNKPARNAQPLMFAADRETIDYAGRAAHLQLLLTGGDRDDSFIPWRIPHGGLVSFLEELAAQAQ